MPPDDRIRLLHMLDAAREALGLSHEREREDLDLVWDTIALDLPPLIVELEKILEEPDVP